MVRVALVLPVVLGCGSHAPADPVDSAADVGVTDGAVDAAMADAAIDAAVPVVGADPCVVYRADAEVDNVIDLYLSCVDPEGGPAQITKLDAPLVTGGDVQSTFRVAPGVVAYVADGDTDGVNEIYVVHVGATTVSPAVKVNLPLGTGEQVVTAQLAADGSTLAYLVTSPSLPAGGRLYAVDLSGDTIGTPVAVDEVNDAPLCPDGVRQLKLAGSTLVFDCADLPAGRAWHTFRFTGGVAGVPVRITPWHAYWNSNYLLSVLDDDWVMYSAMEIAPPNTIDAFLVDLRGGAPTQVTPSMVMYGEALQLGAQFASHDDGALAFTADATMLDSFELFAGRMTGGVLDDVHQISGAKVVRGDVQPYRFAPGAGAIAFTATANGHVGLYGVDLAGATPGAPVELDDPAGVGVDSFAFGTASRLVFRTDPSTDGTNRSDLYITDVAGGSPTLVSSDAVGGGLFVLLGAPTTGHVYFSERGESTIDLMQLDLSAAGTSKVRVNGDMLPGANASNAVLSRDERALFFLANAENLTLRELYRVDVGGPTPGTPQKLSGPIVAFGALYGFAPFSRASP